MSKGIREKGAGVRKEVFRNTEEIRDDGAYHCSNDEARVIVEQCKKERCSASTDRVSREQSANNRVAMFRRTWQSKQKKTTLVVGGGIAGISAARAFAERGWQVTLLEKAPELASCASGNPAGVLFPRVSRDWNPATQFYWTAYALMLRQLERWQKEGLEIPGEQCGMLYSPTLEKKRWQLQENRLDLPSEVLRWVEAEEASKLTGLALSEGGLWFGQGSWVNAQALCRVLVNHPNITVQYGVEAAELSSFLRKQESISRETECCEIGSCLRRNDGNVSGLEYRWRTDDTSGNCYYADCVVIANAAAASRFPQASALKMAENRGQITYLPEKAVSQPLQAIYCRHGYMIPAEGHYVLGATYDHDNLDTTLRDADHLENITQMEEAVAGCLQEVPETFRGRVSLRTTTPQRLPYIGAIAPGLYVSLGHGSRGLLSAPLAAECLAALAENTPLPVSKAVEAVIKPPR